MALLHVTIIKIIISHYRVNRQYGLASKSDLEHVEIIRDARVRNEGSSRLLVAFITANRDVDAGILTRSEPEEPPEAPLNQP